MRKRISTPTVAQLEEELHRVSYLTRFHGMLRSTISVLVIVAAAAVLVATLILPVLRIYGTSMTPTLADGDIIVSVKTESYQKGDILAFYFNNKILVKRVIALPGEWVDIDAEGNVFVNGERLVEPYLTEKSLGECDIESFWATIAQRPWIAVAQRLAAFRKNRSSESSCSEYGRLARSA